MLFGLVKRRDAQRFHYRQTVPGVPTCLQETTKHSGIAHPHSQLYSRVYIFHIVLLRRSSIADLLVQEIIPNEPSFDKNLGGNNNNYYCYYSWEHLELGRIKTKLRAVYVADVEVQSISA